MGRGLVVIKREAVGWRGEGEYGRLAHKWSPWHNNIPTALTVRAGEPWPFRDGCVARSDVEFYRVGMPTPGLLVWPLTSGNALTSPNYS